MSNRITIPNSFSLNFHRPSSNLLAELPNLPQASWAGIQINCVISQGSNKIQIFIPAYLRFKYHGIQKL